MNGRYLVASGGRQGVPFNDDYASKGHEYFDVYSPEIATHYGEVFWTDQGNNPLPKKIIQRFNGRSDNRLEETLVLFLLINSLVYLIPE